MAVHRLAHSANTAAMLVVVSRVCMPAARRLRSNRVRLRLLHASGAGLEVSRSDFLQHGFVETQISDQFLEPGVFLFEILELAGLVGF